MRGLPAELTDEEVARLRSALPQQLTRAPAHPSRLAIEADPGSEPSSWLKRITASITRGLFFCVCSLVPYLMLMIKLARRIDQRYQLSTYASRKLVAVSQSIIAHGTALAVALSAIDDGRIVEALTRLFTWWVHGVIAGIYHGIREGMRMDSTEPEDNP